MEAFYCGKLGLNKTLLTRTTLSIKAGGTELTFTKTSAMGEGPLTHIAFNIPQNKIRTALDWTKKRVEVIPAWGNLTDPAYPKDIIHFRHWNAHSIFFWDPAHNLVEFIARHDLANDDRGDFGPRDIQCLSEIGLAVKDPAQFAKFLNSKAGIPAYPAGTAPAFAMGDENGLLLCLLQGQVWGEHTATPRTWNPYKTEIELAGASGKTLTYPGYPFSIKMST